MAESGGKVCELILNWICFLSVIFIAVQVSALFYGSILQDARRIAKPKKKLVKKNKKQVSRSNTKEDIGTGHQESYKRRKII